MMRVQLRRIDQARNMRRYYVLAVEQDLFGGWWLVREHGRIGSPGRVIETPFPDLDAAAAAHAKLWQQKVRKGYGSA